jgi:hypothetical protein
METITTQGVAMPRLGFGTFRMPGTAAQSVVERALALGYRRIDTAAMYENEAAVGAAIAASGVTRTELFVTTKVWLFQAPGFAVGLLMALIFYLLSSYYLTFSIYLQGGRHLTPLAAGLETLPFGLGYFLASFAAAGLMRWFGPSALTLGFAVQVVGFGLVMLAVAGAVPGALRPGLAVAGAGFGIVMPSVIGGMAVQHAGLAAGVVMSTLQIGAALGVVIIGCIFCTELGAGQDLASHAHAVVVALGCNVAMLALGGVLSLWLPGVKG